MRHHCTGLLHICSFRGARRDLRLSIMTTYRAGMWTTPGGPALRARGGIEGKLVHVATVTT